MFIAYTCQCGLRHVHCMYDIKQSKDFKSIKLPHSGDYSNPLNWMCTCTNENQPDLKVHVIQSFGMGSWIWLVVAVKIKSKVMKL